MRVGDRVQINCIPQVWCNGMRGTVVAFDGDPDDLFPVRVHIDPGPRDAWVDKHDDVWFMPEELIVLGEGAS